MYICICHKVTDRDIRRAVKKGVHSVDQLGDTLKVATGCGACAADAKKCLEKTLEQTLTLEDAVAA